MYARLADCLSTNKEAFEMTTDIAASAAVDDDVATYSCTMNTRSYPWWYVDLGQEYYIDRVSITFPSDAGDICNYRLFFFVINSFIC